MWPTTAEVYAERARRGWVSPIAPLEPGDHYWLAVFPGGLYEVMAHPADAAVYLEDGIVLDKMRLPVRQVDAYPLLNGILLNFRDPRQARDGFLDSALTGETEAASNVAAA